MINITLCIEGKMPEPKKKKGGRPPKYTDLDSVMENRVYSEHARESYSFGEYIRTLRKAKHLSLKDAATKMKMPPGVLCDMEAGRKNKRYVSIEVVALISDAYSVPIADIIRATRTAIHNQRTLADIMTELSPACRLAELISARILEMSTQFSPELEKNAEELLNYIKNIQVLVSLLGKRHLSVNEKETNLKKVINLSADDLPDPDKMNGAGDIFPGTSEYE